ncbi:hypothetical protein, partial [Bilophila sp.]|uniref:hypothetical protein n=1 Tax=Bilophila sp. TaxID=1929485 RepID=UPI003076A321
RQGENRIKRLYFHRTVEMKQPQYNRAKKYRPTADMFILLALSWDVAASYPQYGNNTGFFSNFPLMGSIIVALYCLLPWNFKE